jgi:hypothetical protein
MLSSPQKNNNQYYCTIETTQDFVERCQIIKDGERYMADLNSDNPTEQFEELLLNELGIKAPEWFDVSPEIINRFFLYSGDNIIITFEEEGVNIKEDQIYEIRFRPARLLIDKSSFQVEYICYSIEEDNMSPNDDIHQEVGAGDENTQEEENVNFLANLNLNSPEQENITLEVENQEIDAKDDINLGGEGGNETDRQFSIVDEDQDINIDTLLGETGDIVGNGEDGGEDNDDRSNGNTLNGQDYRGSQRSDILRKIRELRIQSTMLQIQANKMEEQLYNLT